MREDVSNLRDRAREDEHEAREKLRRQLDDELRRLRPDVPIPVMAAMVAGTAPLNATPAAVAKRAVDVAAAILAECDRRSEELSKRLEELA